MHQQYGGHCSSGCAVHGRDISACHTRCQVMTVKQRAAAGCSVDLAAVRAVGQCSACSGARRAGLPAAAAADALLQHAGHAAVHQAAVPRAAGRGAAEARGHDRLAGGHGFGRACVCTHACARHNDRSHVHMCWYVLLYAAAVVIIQLAVSDICSHRTGLRAAMRFLHFNQTKSVSAVARPDNTLGACCGDYIAVLLVRVALQSGFLSMDQARSLLPLEATDVNVSWPCMGVIHLYRMTAWRTAPAVMSAVRSSCALYAVQIKAGLNACQVAWRTHLHFSAFCRHCANNPSPLLNKYPLAAAAAAARAGVQHAAGGWVGEGPQLAAAPAGGCGLPALRLQQPAG